MAESADWKREQAENAQTLSDIEALLLAGRGADAASLGMNYGLWEEVPGLLHKAWTSGRMDDSTMSYNLPEVWIANKGPLLCLDEHAWVAMFRTAGFQCRVEETVGHDTVYPMEWHDACPTGPFTLWRGALLDGGGKGMSWTLHRACALEFAQRISDRYGPAALYRVTLPEQAVLAMFVNESEQEVVVDPSFLPATIEVVQEVSGRAQPYLPDE